MSGRKERKGRSSRSVGDDAIGYWFSIKSFFFFLQFHIPCHPYFLSTIFPIFIILVNVFFLKRDETKPAPTPSHPCRRRSRGTRIVGTLNFIDRIEDAFPIQFRLDRFLLGLFSTGREKIVAAGRTTSSRISVTWMKFRNILAGRSPTIFNSTVYSPCYS